MSELAIHSMKIIDVPDPKRISQKPKEVEVVFKSGDFVQDGFSVNKIELRQYIEKTDEKLGPYSLITSYVETDKGSVEMVYDEGFRGKNALNRTVKFLISNLGISGLILRSLITLKNHLDEEKK